MKITKIELIGEVEYITAHIENDEKVDRIIVKYKRDWDRVIDIIVFYKSGRNASYSGNLSNHRFPPKYRNYVSKIMKEVK